jgi:hypothetical protein
MLHLTSLCFYVLLRIKKTLNKQVNHRVLENFELALAMPSLPIPAVDEK